MVFFNSLPVPKFREWVFPIPFPFPNPQKSFPLTPGSVTILGHLCFDNLLKNSARVTSLITPALNNETNVTHHGELHQFQHYIPHIQNLLDCSSQLTTKLVKSLPFLLSNWLLQVLSIFSETSTYALYNTLAGVQTLGGAFHENVLSKIKMVMRVRMCALYRGGFRLSGNYEHFMKDHSSG